MSLTPTAVQILLALSAGPLHGYALMRTIHHHLGIRIGPGLLYTTIHKLLDHQLVEEPPSTDPRRRPYAITPAGRDALTAEFRSLSRLLTWAEQAGAIH